MSCCCTTEANDANGTATEACCTVTDEQETAQSALRIQHCPVCGAKGKDVDTQTVKAMLNISLHSIRTSGYGFCRTQGCEVVYFSLDGEQTIAESDLRVLVHQKHPHDDDVFVCYCFRHTPGSIRAELVNIGESTVIETVTRGTQTDQCACDIRNPQGSCCLGNVNVAVKRIKLGLEPVAV